ncbi:MAG: hypothetical protein WC082_03195 [Victivallales bacterium]
MKIPAGREGCSNVDNFYIAHILKIIRLLCLAVTVTVSGCMSARMTTNLKPSADPKLKSAAGKFYIEGIKYTNISSSQPREDKPALAKSYENDFRNQLLSSMRKECVARYPGLFSTEPASAIPLRVDVKHMSSTDSSQVPLKMFCTLLLCGTILPLSTETDEKIELDIGIDDGRGNIAGKAVKKSFERKSEVWVSVLLPTALIPIPGESDFPKISGTILGIDKQVTDSARITAQQIITAVAKAIITKNIAYWKTAPPRIKTPVLSSAPSTVTSMQVTPASETSEPF